jgi:hypothetical protein
MVMLCLKTPVSREVQGMGGVRPAVVAAVDAGGNTGVGAAVAGEAPPSPKKGRPTGNTWGTCQPGSEKKLVGESMATPASRPSTSKLNRSSESTLGIRLGTEEQESEEAIPEVDCSSGPSPEGGAVW